MAKRRQTYDKFRKERLRKEKKQIKAEKRAERKEIRADSDLEASDLGDPDLAGIVAGPQPAVDPMTGLAPLRATPPQSTPPE